MPRCARNSSRSMPGRSASARAFSRAWTPSSIAVGRGRDPRFPGRDRRVDRKPPPGPPRAGRAMSSAVAARRRVLKALAAAPFALSAPRFARAAGGERLFVMVYLYGGNDGYNTWVPYSNPEYYRVRPNIAIARDTVIRISENHGFHPSVAALMPPWNARQA